MWIMSEKIGFTVFFDGSCPLCVREIGFYQRRQPLAPVAWVDVSQTNPLALDIPLSQCDAMRRFHIQDETGRLKSGAAAFTALWRRYKGFQTLGWLFSLPLLRHGAEAGYRVFLTVRPTIQRLTHLIVKS